MSTSNLTRSLTTNHIQRVQRPNRIHIALLARAKARQRLDHGVGLAIEDLDKLLEDLEVKGGRQNLAPLEPFLAVADQQALVQPRLDVLVLARFVDELGTAQQNLGAKVGRARVN